MLFCYSWRELCRSLLEDVKRLLFLCLELLRYWAHFRSFCRLVISCYFDGDFVCFYEMGSLPYLERQFLLEFFPFF